jgi:hypothetical protein
METRTQVEIGLRDSDSDTTFDQDWNSKSPWRGVAVERSVTRVASNEV